MFENLIPFAQAAWSWLTLGGALALLCGAAYYGVRYGIPHIKNARWHGIAVHIDDCLLRAFNSLGDAKLTALKAAVANGTLATAEKALIDDATLLLKKTPAWPFISVAEGIDPDWKEQIEKRAIALVNGKLSQFLDGWEPDISTATSAAQTMAVSATAAVK